MWAAPYRGPHSGFYCPPGAFPAILSEVIFGKSFNLCSWRLVAWEGDPGFVPGPSSAVSEALAEHKPYPGARTDARARVA